MQRVMSDSIMTFLYGRLLVWLYQRARRRESLRIHRLRARAEQRLKRRPFRCLATRAVTPGWAPPPAARPGRARSRTADSARAPAVTKAVRKTPRVGFLPRRSENETAPDSPARLSFRTHQEGTQRDRIVYRNGPFASGGQRLSKHRNDRHQMVRYGHRSEYNCGGHSDVWITVD